MQSYEKLGAFYLGKTYDTEQGAMGDELYLYDSRDLVTHAVCVGMTGSGKTGLCVTLIEEAAIDGVPAIVIDPKGDLTNLLLTFPDLSAASFKPWVNEDAARTKGLTLDAFASAQANLWKKGLADWGQDGSRIQRLKDAAEFAVYTPGSTAATPVSILSTLEAPGTDDVEILADRAATTTSSLLGLLGVGDDNLTSREHVLLSNILIESWRNGVTLDLAGLIRAIQSPPMSRVGVLELESFYPSKDRFELAMRFNALLASPRFATWLDGAPLDVDRFLFTESGKPRISVFSIAHLDDAERMFFVSLLLNETLAWMRTRPGTSSLRALLYMDEIFGYLPPVANPPSKRPLLTMLKQARAHGLGLVLATQNPADIDYKALSNAGTWFIGRLQTERDKQRLLAGLQSTGSEQGEDLEGTIANLGKRVFLARNVHEQGETTFHTRWAMSYLAGPMTRDQLKRVTAGDAAKASHAGAASTRASKKAGPAPVGAPMLSAEIPQWFLDAPLSDGSLTYHPAVVGIAEVRMRQRGGSDEIVEKVGSAVPLGPNTRKPDWGDSIRDDVTADDLRDSPVSGAAFAPLPAVATNAKNYAKWRKEFSDQLYRTVRSTIYRSKAFKMTSEIGESERDFRIRLGDKARETRDDAVEKLRKRFATKFTRMDERILRAEQRVGREKDDVKSAKMQTAVSLGATLLSAFLGRKAVSAGSVGKASTTLRGAGRTARQASDVKRAKQTLEDLKLKRQELADQFDEEVDALEDRFDAQMETLEEIEVKPRRTDIHVENLSLLWIPGGR